MSEKITPETYKKMNEEFEEEGLPFRIIVPTQEQIDKWRNESMIIYSNRNQECEKHNLFLETVI